MNTTRRQVIKTTGVLGTLVSLGIITQAQALAADERPGFSNKSFADAVNALGGSPANSADIILDTPRHRRKWCSCARGRREQDPWHNRYVVLDLKEPLPLGCGL